MIKLDFEEKYVAFLDVLGFSEMVNDKKIEKLQTYFNKVIEAFKIFDDDGKDLQKLMISDSVILIASNTEPHFKMLLRAIQSLQIYLIKEEIILRGAVSKGEVYYNPSHNIIVGKGYIKAYLLEKDAIYPRVLIDPSIISGLAEDRLHFYQTMQIGQSGVEKYPLVYINFQKEKPINEDAIFVNYASRMIIEAINGNEQQLEVVLKHIREGLYLSQNNYSKYLWIKNHFLGELHNHIAGIEEFLDSKHKAFIEKWIFKFQRI